ncbi:hypothetical protein [Bradyrhizobium amphicarpaeae]|uniref:Uncharacterized protein n=1 Tax=Bradyrhizobium amphicarpaeae TaxID=1404768 RepID=A0A2U8PPZ4_9BRAD|nr:hypothetical protein [Bradyrhizobium amphicarpaeae]AWL99865.1 hypothetical protein CIT40_07340 [Bradyrhizobium amphicarpaeae]
MSNMQNTTLIATGIIASLPLIPVGHYLLFGWPARKQQIVSRLSNQSIGYYRMAFCPESEFTDNVGFSKEYDRRYGRPLFLVPMLLLSITLFAFSYYCVSWVLSHDWASAQEGTAKIAILSLAGAYMWITYDLIFRARQNDVVTSDVNRATLRLLISLPFGFAISAFAGVVTGSTVTLSTGALAFFVGAFPTDTVLKFMRRTAAIPLKLDADTSEDGVQQLTKIDGITVPIAERFIDEGVKTIVQLAYADPVALSIRSGMDFSFILICCSRAMVKMYFDDNQMKIVQKYGLRSGLEIKTLNDELLNYDELRDQAVTKGEPAPAPTSSQAAAQRQLQAFANAVALDTDSTRFVLDQIAEDPYTKFAWWMWPDVPGTGEHPDEREPVAPPSPVVAAELTR